MNKFEETQWLRTVWWYWAIFFPLASLGALGLLKLVGAKDDDQVNFTLILLSLIAISLAVFFFFARLKTEFNEKEIVVKFFLFPVFIKKTITWSQVSKVFIRKYDWSEFKATGLGSIPIGNRGIVYHLFGEYGLQIETNDGDKILIGTRKPKSLQEFLKRLNKL